MAGSDTPQQLRNLANSAAWADDEFRISFFKVLPCARRASHNWKNCPFAHPGEKVRRRSLAHHTYSAVMCENARRGQECPLGDACPNSHSVFEVWLHPQRFKTQLCCDGSACTRKVCFFAHSEADLRRPQPPGDVCAPLPPRADSGGVACTTQAEAGMGAHDELGAHWSSLFASSGLAALPSSQQDCGSSAIASIGSQGASPFTPPVTQALLLPTSSPLALLDQQVVLQAEQEKSSTHACTGMVAAASSGYVGAGAFVQAAPSSPGLAGCGYPFGEQGVDQLAHGSLRLQQHQRFWEQCMQPGAHFAAMMGAGGALGASQAGSGNFCTQMASAGSTRCAGGDAATPTALASRVQHPSADCSADVAALQLRILALGPSPLPISGEALALARDGGLHQCSHLPAQMFAAAAPAASSGPHATQLAHRHQPQRSAGGGGGGGAMLQCSAAASSPLMALHQEHPCQQ